MIFFELKFTVTFFNFINLNYFIIWIWRGSIHGGWAGAIPEHSYSYSRCQRKRGLRTHGASIFPCPWYHGTPLQSVAQLGRFASLGAFGKLENTTQVLPFILSVQPMIVLNMTCTPQEVVGQTIWIRLVICVFLRSTWWNV